MTESVLTQREPGPHPGLATHAATEPLRLGIPALDEAYGLTPGEVLLLEAGGPWWSVRHRLVLEAFERGLPVLQVVAGNRLDPYGLARAAQRAGHRPEEVLDHSLMARAFTAHQLSALVEEELPSRLDGPALVLFADPLALYQNDEIRPAEGRRLLRRALRRFHALVRAHNAYGVILEHPFARSGPAEEFLKLDGPHIHLRQERDRLLCDLMHARRRIVQHHAWPQARLDDYGLVVLPMVEESFEEVPVFQGASSGRRPPPLGRVGPSNTPARSFPEAVQELQGFVRDPEVVA